MINKGVISTYADNLEDFVDRTPIKVWIPLQFFKLKGRTTKMIKENLVPYKNIEYCVLSPAEKRYYLKTYRNYSVDTLYFYRRDLDFSGEDSAVESLRRYIYDGNVWLLFTRDMIDETTTFLQRLWKTELSGEGRVPYKRYIHLLQQSIDYEDYRSYSSGLTGYKTVCNQFETRLKSIWKDIYNSVSLQDDKT